MKKLSKRDLWARSEMSQNLHNCSLINIGRLVESGSDHRDRHLQYEHVSFALYPTNIIGQLTSRSSVYVILLQSFEHIKEKKQAEVFTAIDLI